MNQAVSVKEYPELVKHERRHVATLQRRADHLERQLASTGQTDQSYIARELRALQWALADIDKRFKVSP